jgi:DNA-binding NarL/FixJ family response regulator
MRLTPLMDWLIARCQDFTLDLKRYLPEGTVVDLKPEPDYYQAIVVVSDKDCLEKIAQYAMKLEGRWHVEAFMKGNFATERIFDARGALDLAVIDLDLEDINSNLLISEIRSRYPVCSIVGISKFPKESAIITASAHGANSFAIYSDSEQIIVSMLSSTIAGNASFSGKIVERLFKSERPAMPQAAITADFNLTAREIDTLRGIAAGMTYAQVARKMEISVSTVQSHIRNLYRKLSVDSQSKAIIKARSMGLRLGLDFTHSADVDTASQRPVSTDPHNATYPFA